jgi:hypothetical protein
VREAASSVGDWGNVLMGEPGRLSHYVIEHSRRVAIRIALSTYARKGSFGSRVSSDVLLHRLS